MSGASNQPKRTWRVVEFEVDKQHEELAGWLMMQVGANGVELESRGGDAALVRATFEPEVLPRGDLGKLSSALDEYGLNQCLVSLRTNVLQESDWLAEWKKGFEPFVVGKRILVCPPWLRDTLSSEQVSAYKVILIEPGLAFGTGFHATTRFCLDALQEYVDGASTVLDVGSGTGILSIAVAKLNPSAKTIAVEIDPTAVKVCRENLELNGVADRIELIEGSTEAIVERFAQQFDLLLSNMTYEDNAALLADYLKLAKPGCHILFAGVLKEKVERMRSAIANAGLQLIREDVGEMWAGLVARRN